MSEVPRILAHARDSPAASAWTWASGLRMKLLRDVLVKASGCLEAAEVARPAPLLADLVAAPALL